MIIDKIQALLEKVKRIGYKNDVDYEYIKLAKKILKEGVYRQGRNGGTYSIFGAQMRFDLSKGLPILTTRKMFYRSTIHELIWFIKGDTSAKYLKDNNVGIWDLWIDEKGDLPHTYPEQWRKFPGANGIKIDQLANAIELIKKDPYSRRIIVNSWNPAFLVESGAKKEDQVALPWCHSFFQFYVQNGKLSCHFYQRSADFALGTVSLWSTYSIVVYLVAQICNLEVGELIWSGGDVHIYENQIESMSKIFGKKTHKLPQVKINPNLKNIDDLKFEDIEIIDYKHEAFIKIPVSQ